MLVAVREPVIEVFTFTLNPDGDIDAVAVVLAIRSKLSPVTPDAWIFVNLDPSPINDPVKKDDEIDPTSSIEPVFCVLVMITSSTDGPLDPDFARKIFPSVVFIDNSPNSSCALFGTLQGKALLRSFTVCAIYMGLYYKNGIYHDII